MYGKTTARKGAQTFVMTLVISLLLFGAVYYFLTDFSSEVDIETTTVAYNPGRVKGTKAEESIFGEIAEAPVTGHAAVVLAGADDVVAEESTESVVPETGSETLIGTILAMGFFSLAVFIILSGTRGFALSGFEKDMTKEK